MKPIIAIILLIIAMTLITVIAIKIIPSIPKKPEIINYPSVPVNKTTNTNEQIEKKQENTYDSYSLVNKRYDNHVTINPDGTKHYRNERYGLEFDFPGDWTTSEPAFGNKKTIEFNMEILDDIEYHYPDPILIAVFPKDTGWIDKVIAYYKKKGFKIEKIVIDGVEGVKYEDLSVGLPHIFNFFPVGDYWIEIGGKEKYEDVLNGILKSTQFFTPNYDLK